MRLRTAKCRLFSTLLPSRRFASATSVAEALFLPFLLLLPVTLLILPESSFASRCPGGGKNPEAFVESATAVRRGPGLNYPVSAFLEKGRCMRVQEVSIDKIWILVDDGKNLGWVPANRIDPESRAKLEIDARAKPTSPIGSGQERGFVVTKRVAILRAGPQKKAAIKKELPAGSRILAISASKDGRWIEARDERGELGWISVLDITDGSTKAESLPVSSEEGLSTGIGKAERVPARKDQDPSAPKVTPTEEDAAPREEETARQEETSEATRQDVATGLGHPRLDRRLAGEISFDALGIFAFPQHKLDTNSPSQLRRYALRASGVGVQLEAQTKFAEFDLGSPIPLEVHLNYSAVFMSGLKASDDPSLTVPAQEHAGRISVVALLDAGTQLILSPELGYSLAIFAIQPAFPGRNPQFVSNQTHALIAGMSGLFMATEAFGIELGAYGTAGFTHEYPIDLGTAKFGFGAAARVGVQYAIGGALSAILRWDLRYRATSFQGASTFDPSVTTAEMIDVEQGVSAGIRLVL